MFEHQQNLYVGAPTIAFAPAIVGATAPQFTVFALPSCTSFTLNSHTLFTGLIYAPDTTLSANGTADIAGAIACKSFSLMSSPGAIDIVFRC